jgi:hypothetical protein
MQPLASIRYPIMMRVKRETMENLCTLARGQGLRVGPFSVHVMETISQCPPDRFHAAMAAFMDEINRRR